MNTIYQHPYDAPDLDTERRIALEHAIDQDLRQHLEDDLLVNAIRGGRLVPIRWHNLSDAERRAAFNVTNQPNY